MSKKEYNLELQHVLENIKGIYESSNLLETLTDFERVLDNLDMYAFKNWGKGELVKGPISSRYWITCEFFWPKKLPPDPRFTQRLKNNGIDITVKKGVLRRPIKVESYKDFEQGTFFPKLAKYPVWVMEICMPMYLIKEVEKGYLALGQETINLSELEAAYDQDLDMEGVTNQDTEEKYSE